MVHIIQAAEATASDLEKASKQLQTAIGLLADVQFEELEAAEALANVSAPVLSDIKFQAAHKNEEMRTAALRVAFPQQFAKAAGAKAAVQSRKSKLDQAKIEWETQMKIANLQMATMKMMGGSED